MPACYRHPDRETGVSCSSCERPICPECMSPSPVGMRCPECSQDTTRVERGVQGLGSGAAPAVTVLIVLNVLGYVGQLVGGAGGLGGAGGSVIRDFALFGPAVADGEWYRIFTAAFLHAGLIHIGFNMFALYILGSILEPALGTPRFIAIYVVSLLGGSFGALLVTPAAFTVGASGAVFGIMAATFLVARERGLDQLAAQVGFFVVINLVLTFSIASISVGGHIGGLMAGALMVGLANALGGRGTRMAPAEVAVGVGLGLALAAGAVVVA